MSAAVHVRRIKAKPIQSNPRRLEPMLSGFTAWTTQITSYQAAWQQEWWGFVSHRFGKDVDFMQQLASCQAPDQVARVSTEFIKQAFDDYQNELATLTQLGTEMTVASVPAVPNGHDVLAPNELEMLGRLNA